jgi:Integrase core domain
MDVMGPFIDGRLGKKTGYKFIVVIVDLFSRWVIAKAIPDQEAVTITNFLKRHVFTKFGYPRSILTDQGRNFLSFEVRDLLQRAGVMHMTTTPYHQQANGKVERVNKMLGEALRCYVGSEGIPWPDHLGHIVHALNTSHCTPTDMTPFMAVFGKEARSRLDGQYGWTQNFIEENYPPDDDNQDYRFHLRCYAMCKMEIQKWDNKRRYDKSRRNLVYQAGDLVMKRIDAPTKKLGKKLTQKFRGPYIVVRRVSFLNYELLRVLGTKGPVVAHVSKLKMFVQRGIKATPLRESLEEAFKPLTPLVINPLDPPSAPTALEAASIVPPEILPPATRAEPATVFPPTEPTSSKDISPPTDEIPPEYGVDVNPNLLVYDMETEPEDPAPAENPPVRVPKKKILKRRAPAQPVPAPARQPRGELDYTTRSGRKTQSFVVAKRGRK